MKKTKAKLTCIFLTICILFTSNVLCSFASQTTSGYCGDGVSWSFNSMENALEISGVGRMYNYGESEIKPWDAYSDDIIVLEVEDGVSYIGSYAFSGLINLIELEISAPVNEIGRGAFDNTGWLNEAVGDFITVEGVLIRYNADENEVELPETVTGIGTDAFYGNTEITSVSSAYVVNTISDEAFCGCTSLESVTFSSLNFVCDYVFDGCTALTEVSLSDKLEHIGSYCFENTLWLDSSNEDFVVVSDMLVAYKGAGGMITVPDGTKGIASAFSENDDITSVRLPDSLEYIGMDSFYDCDALSCVIFGNGLEKIETYGFMNCPALTELFLPNSLKTIGENAFENCTALTTLTLSSSLTTIGSYAFGSCSSLGNVVIPQSVRKVGDCAFLNCNSLKKVFSDSTSISFGKRAIGYNIGGTGFVLNKAITLVGADNSRLHEYALDNSIDFMTSCAEHTFTKTTRRTGCSRFGYEKSVCSVCGRVEINNVLSPSDHSFSHWVDNGEYNERTCFSCKKTEYDKTTINSGWSYSYTTGLLEIFGDVTETDEFISCKKNARYLILSSDNGMDFNTSTNLRFAYLDKEYDTYPEMFASCSKLENAVVSNEDVSWMPCSDRFIISGNYENGYATGFTGSADESFFPYDVIKTNNIVGTGAEFTLKVGGFKLAETTAVIYGDLNCDGVSDGTDAVIANAIIDGMEVESNDAILKAADCNKNGVTDENDVSRIINNGLFIDENSQNE